MLISPVGSFSNTDGEDRPTKLLRVGLTNRPQIPIKPLINSVRKHNPPEGVPETTKENPKMDKLKELLGLAADASDDDVLSAVTALKGEVEAAKTEKADAEAEAEAFANENGETEEEKEALKNAFKASAEMAALPPAERAAYFKAHASEF